MNERVRVRIAPSPTGDPHVGTAYIALFNWMFARQHDGDFILRIEDTDQTRCSEKSEQEIFDTLKWLGLDYDEGPDVGGDFGPYRQSERLSIYKKYSDELIEKGAAYRCFCTKERLEELKALNKKLKKPMGYDGHCRYMDSEEIKRRLANGESYVVRLKVNPEGNTVFVDWLRKGEIVFENKEIDDQVLLKSDGFPTYHLANVIDDHLMNISHVIRAEEWISSVPKHVMIYEAFGWQPPQYIHMPLLRNQDKSKISKRKNPVSLTWYRQAGYLPEALVNFLALQGWSLDGEHDKFTRQEMLDAFDIKRVSISGPVFDLEKLGWLNGLYIREMDPKKLKELLDPYMPQTRKMSEKQIQMLLPLVQERLRRLDQWDELTYYFYDGLISFDPELLRVRKKNKPDGLETHSPSEVAELLSQVIDQASNSMWNAAKIEDCVKKIIKESEGWKPPEVFMLLRKATTGTTQTPPIFDVLEIIGQDNCLARWHNAVSALGSLEPCAKS